MARKERLTEEVRYLTETLKLLWLTIVALVGGVAGLLLAELGLRRAAIWVGVLVTLGLLAVVGQVHRRINARINDLEEV